MTEVVGHQADGVGRIVSGGHATPPSSLTVHPSKRRGRPARLSAPPGLACRVPVAVRVAQAEDEPPGFEPKIRAHGTAGEHDSLDDRRVIRSPSERGPGELQSQWNELEPIARTQ